MLVSVNTIKVPNIVCVFFYNFLDGPRWYSWTETAAALSNVSRHHTYLYYDVFCRLEKKDE